MPADKAPHPNLLPASGEKEFSTTGSGAPYPLGVTAEDYGINVAVVSRHGERISICLFDEAGGKETHRFSLPERLGDIHYGFIAGVKSGGRYGLRAEGPWEPAQGHRFDPAKLLVDPYAKRIDRAFVHCAELSAPPAARLDTAPWVPKAIALPPSPPAPRIAARRPQFIYELAIKAFTKRHPQIPQVMRGTIAALAHPVVIDHLTRLGVDTVELMPLAAWIDERHLPALGLHNAWGYNPVAFMAPDPRLAPGGVEDLKMAVAALHEAGIRVLLDVVFNHTGESDVFGTTLSLRGLDNALYYRHAADDPGKLVNDTGCGNTLAFDRAPVVRLVMDAMRHWVEATGIDGFRFDLATVLGRTAQGFSLDAPLLAAIGQDPLLSTLTLIAEPWDVGPDGYRLGGFPAGWNEWNDRYRDDVRRFWRGGPGVLGTLATRLAGSSDIFGSGHRRPSASINYIAAHDGFALRDTVTFRDKHNDANGEGNRDGKADEISWTAEDAPRDMRNLLATLFLSKGTPMLTAGDEFGRTQNGNNNAYAQDNETTWLNWEHADQSLAQFVAELVRLRKTHPALTSDFFLSGRPDEEGIADAAWLKPDGSPMSAGDWGDPHNRVVGLTLHAEGDRILLWINGGLADLAIKLPHPRDGFKWVCAFTTSGQSNIVASRSVSLFAEERSQTTGVDDETVRRLASEAGINLEWWEVDGTHHDVTPETLRVLLAAMRLPASTRSEVRDSLARLSAAKQRSLPRTLVIRADESEPISGPASHRRVLHVASGDSQPLRIDVPQGETQHLPPLPVGYYDCWFDDQPDTRCRLIVAPGACFLPEELSGDGRHFGFAAHLYALRRRGDRGIGDFETLARFGEASASVGGVVAGINPLHHMFPSDRDRASPYQPSDRRFIDPIYIDIDGLLAEWSFPSAVKVARKNFAAFADLCRLRYIDYRGVWQAKAAILDAAFRDFSESSRSAEFEKFTEAGGRDLEQHGLFETLVAEYGTQDQANWPKGANLTHFANANRIRIRFRAWLQWIAERQFAKATARAQSAGLTIGFYRDLALGSAFDGGEIWADPECFAEGVSIGAPPDPFAREGQVWNLPPHSPWALAAQGFTPFVAVVSANMRHAGALRIDHILGYARQFWVPKGAPGAQGAYVRFPIDTLIAVTALESHRHRCMVIGEDLGTVPEGLRQQLAAAHILSYRVLWFERDGIEFRPPATYPRLSTSCLSSHDLPTFMGWRRSVTPTEVDALDRAMRREGIDPGSSDEDALAAVHEFVARTPSAVMLVQIDDVEGETEPLNVPGTDRERPNWRRRNRDNIEDLGRNTRLVESVKKGRRR